MMCKHFLALHVDIYDSCQCLYNQCYDMYMNLNNWT